LGYFVWKITILCQKIIFFPILGGARPPWIRPWDRWYRPLYFNSFWDKVDIVYVTLLFEQWIVFKNLQFILLFLNIWTLTFYCFRLENVFYSFLIFRVSNHHRAFQSLFWLSKLPSKHSTTVTILLYAIISIFDSW
jgi:hypothetical protein